MKYSLSFSFGFVFLVALMSQPCWAQELITDPAGATVFHKVQGKHHFIGHTPLKLTPDLIANKLTPRLLILKYGYQEVSLVVDVAQRKPVQVQLQPAAIQEQTYSQACESRLITKLQETFNSTPQTLEVFPPMVVTSPSDKERMLLLRVQVVNQDDAYAIRRTRRLDAANVLPMVSKIVDSTLGPIVQVASQGDCLSKMQVDVQFKKSRRLKLKSVQTQTGGMMVQSWDTNIGGDIYRTTKHLTWSGTKTSVQAAIAIDRDQQIISLRYDFRELTDG